MDKIDDKELIAGCIKGDSASQEQLIRNFSRPVYKSVHYTLKNLNVPFCQADVEDLHNTVFMKLFEGRARKLAQFSGKNGCSLYSWIRLIAVRTVLDYIRKANRDPLACQKDSPAFEGFLELQGDSPSVLSAMEKGEQIQLLQASMEKLLPRDKLFIKLHFFQEVPIPEVAGILGINENTAYQLKHRAVIRLREKLEGRIKN